MINKMGKLQKISIAMFAAIATLVIIISAVSAQYGGGGGGAALPDLIVSELTIGPSGSDMPGQYAGGTAVISNIGSADTNTAVGYYVHRIDSSGDIVISKAVATMNLKAGESLKIAIGGQIFFDSTKFKLVLDPNNLISESNEYNNEKSVDYAATTTSVSSGGGGTPILVDDRNLIPSQLALTLYVRDALTQNPIQNAEVILLKKEARRCEEIALPAIEPPTGCKWVYDYNEEGCLIGRHTVCEARAVATGAQVAPPTAVASGGAGGGVAIRTVEGITIAKDVTLGTLVSREVTDSEGKVTFDVQTGIYAAKISAARYYSTTIENIEIKEVEALREITKVVYLKPIEKEVKIPEPIIEPLRPPPFPDERETVTAELNIKRGWNLVSLPGIFESTKSTCRKDPYGFVYLKEKGEFITIQEAERLMGEKEMQAYLSENAFWIYGFESCRITFELTEYQTFNAIELVEGWNLVPVTVDMKGLSLNDIKASCELKSAYRWEEGAQKWQKINFEKSFSTDDLHKGVLVKTGNSCVLGGAKIVPPEFPEEDDKKEGREFINGKGFEEETEKKVEGRVGTERAKEIVIERFHKQWYQVADGCGKFNERTGRIEPESITFLDSGEFYEGKMGYRCGFGIEEPELTWSEVTVTYSGEITEWPWR